MNAQSEQPQAAPVALITGAARRVGRAIALRLAKAGFAIAIHYNTSANDAEQTRQDCVACGVDADTIRADLADRPATAALVDAVLTRFGRLDALINNASIFERSTANDLSLSEWDRTLQVNLTAPLQLALGARPALNRTGGCIVNLCDVATARPWPDHLAYIVSKGGLETLTAVLARALAPDVRVVGVAPGVAVWPDAYPADQRAQLVKRIPLQRAGTAEDIAEAVHYLLSASYVTGTVIPVDGGRHRA